MQDVVVSHNSRKIHLLCVGVLVTVAVSRFLWLKPERNRASQNDNLNVYTVMKKKKGIWHSKKFQTTVVGMIVTIGGHYGLDLSPDTLMAIVSPLMAYVLGQGIADQGKEKLKLEKELEEEASLQS